MSEFGSDGYVVFFGIIEIYSREFSRENQWKLDVSLSFLHQKLRISSSKVKKILSKISKWETTIEDDKVIVFIPKFTELMDEWTARKLGSCSGVTPKILSVNKIIDKEKEIEIDKDKEKEEPKNFVLPSKDIIQEASELKINTEIKNICKKLYDDKIFPEVIAFKNTMVKNKRNTRSILHVLSRCYLTRPKDPWAFCTKIIENESPNYNARDFLKTT